LITEITKTLIESIFPDDDPQNDSFYHKQIREEVDTNYIERDDVSFTVREVTESK
jgi:hypothetical protein